MIVSTLVQVTCMCTYMSIYIYYDIILNYIILYYNIIYYIVSYYIVLYYIILHYMLFHYIILQYIILYYITLYYTTLYYITLYHITLHYIISYYIYHTILYYTILHYIILYYSTLYYIILYQIAASACFYTSAPICWIPWFFMKCCFRVRSVKPPSVIRRCSNEGEKDGGVTLVEKLVCKPMCFGTQKEMTSAPASHWPQQGIKPKGCHWSIRTRKARQDVFWKSFKNITPVFKTLHLYKNIPTWGTKWLHIFFPWLIRPILR